MSLHRVRTRLRKELAEHKEGERDGHEPTAEAHRVFAGHLAEDLAAVEAAIAGEHAIEKLLRDELDAARAERDALRDAIDRETITHDGDPANLFSEGAMGRLRNARGVVDADQLPGGMAIDHAARDAVASIIESNENAPRDPFYEAKVREIGAHACGAIMRAARHVWLDMLRDEYGLTDGAHTIGPALPVLRRAIGRATGGGVEPLPPRLPVEYDAGGE